MKRIVDILMVFALVLVGLVIPAYAYYQDDLDYWYEKLNEAAGAGDEAYIGMNYFDYEFTVSGGSDIICDIGFFVDDASSINGKNITVEIYKYTIDDYFLPHTQLIKTYTASYKEHRGGHLVGALNIGLKLEPGVYQLNMTPKSGLGGIKKGINYHWSIVSEYAKANFIEYDDLLVPMIAGIAAGYTYSEIEADLIGARNDVNKALIEQAKKQQEELAKKPITLKVDGKVISTDSPPVIEDGRTLAPVRAIVEALGYVVAWDSTTQVVDIYEYETQALRISMKIGSKKVKVATAIWGVMDEVTLDVPAKIINGRTMVPVRFIAETLGCKVNWDASTKTVDIISARG